MIRTFLTFLHMQQILENGDAEQQVREPAALLRFVLCVQSCVLYAYRQQAASLVF